MPGCYSAADDLDDLSANAAEALSLHLEGEQVPEARSLDELRQDPEVVAEIAAGAILIAIPFITLADRTVRVTITMDAALLSAIDQTAQGRELTRSSFLASAARREIGL